MNELNKPVATAIETEMETDSFSVTLTRLKQGGRRKR
jgi:hypothetical protein